MAKTTMKDVAKYTGVSVATVSNVLNNITNKTTEATRQKVLAGVKELNYKVDMTVRSLSMGKSNLIGLFLPEVFENSMPGSVLKENPFYSEIVSGIEYEARLLGYDLLISCISTSDHILELIDKRMLDGIAILGSHDDRFWLALQRADVPIVLIDSYNYKKLGLINIGIDDELGAYLATKHLLTLGHKKIALATGVNGVNDVTERRHTGFRRAIKEADLLIIDCPVLHEALSFRGGITAGHKLLKNHTDVTAVFATADIMALGIIKIMNQFGKKIPDDLSVIGFDDLNIGNYTDPALTTIRQDIYRKGIEVARVLVKKVDKEIGVESQTLPLELVVRDTTKALL